MTSIINFQLSIFNFLFLTFYNLPLQKMKRESYRNCVLPFCVGVSVGDHLVPFLVDKVHFSISLRTTSSQVTVCSLDLFNWTFLVL